MLVALVSYLQKCHKPRLRNIKSSEKNDLNGLKQKEGQCEGANSSSFEQRGGTDDSHNLSSRQPPIAKNAKADAEEAEEKEERGRARRNKKEKVEKKRDKRDRAREAAVTISDPRPNTISSKFKFKIY